MPLACGSTRLCGVRATTQRPQRRNDRYEDAEERRVPPAGTRACERICKQDAAGRADTLATRPASGNARPQVCRGQSHHERSREMGGTYVVVLITRRPEVQILPATRQNGPGIIVPGAVFCHL